MFSFVYMKILEKSPTLYDLGMKILSFGKLRKIKQLIVDEQIHPGDRVLEIGCGTGTLSIMMAQKGAIVEGIDISSQMLKIANEKASNNQLNKNVRFVQAGVAEIDNLYSDNSFDKIISTLVMSELSNDEQIYMIKQARRLLREKGIIIIGDEMVPHGFFHAFIYYLIKIPLAFITYIITHASTRPVKGLEKKLENIGFLIIKKEKRFFSAFRIIYARKVK